MKLHWSPRSPYVRKVMIVAHETGLAGRIECLRSVVVMTRENHEVMRDNPFSKIPTLILDDGRVLFDSAVICEYLDSLHRGAKLFPAGGERRWQALRWHAFGDALLDALILWRNEREREAERQSARLMESFSVRVVAALDMLEREAAAVESADFGIGHVALCCALGYLDFRFADVDWRQGRPGIASWFAAFSTRDSVRATVPSLA